MKKIISIIVLAVALSSCTGKEEYTHDEWQSQYDIECASHITKFNYEVHSYLLYSEGHGRGITHDANCQCKKGVLQ